MKQADNIFLHQYKKIDFFQLLLQILLEVDALHIFHHDILRVPGGYDVIHRADIGMAQHPDGLIFRAEALAGLGVHRHVVPQDLDGHVSLELVVEGFIDHGHAADPKDGDHLIPSVQRLSEPPADLVIHAPRLLPGREPR